MANLDLEDRYFFVPIHKANRKFLRFRFQSLLYGFFCLPFSLATISFYFYQDSKACFKFPGIGPDFASSEENILKTITLFVSIRFIINWRKSVLTPSRKCQFSEF